VQSVQYNGHVAFVGAFPIGIEPERFTRAVQTPAVQSLVSDLSAKFIGRRVILGIDRLDYIKGTTPSLHTRMRMHCVWCVLTTSDGGVGAGIPHKLYALERFLELNPRWIGKVVLVQIAVPSRTDVPEYQRLRSQVPPFPSYPSSSSPFAER
jgi:trehalose-6-phosphate synthase